MTKNRIAVPTGTKRLVMVVIGWKAGNNRDMSFHVPISVSVRPGSYIDISACVALE